LRRKIGIGGHGCEREGRFLGHGLAWNRRQDRRLIRFEDQTIGGAGAGIAACRGRAVEVAVRSQDRLAEGQTAAR